MSSKTSRIILFSILVIGFLLRFLNLNYNSPFLDEAIYIVLGKKILEGKIAEVASSISWVGGFPFFYPLLSAIFYSIGGIIGSRLVNVVLGTSLIYLTYIFTKDLYLDKSKETMRTAALVACALMAASAIPIAFSRLATYDMLAAVLFLAGLIFVNKGILEGDRRYHVASTILLFLAFLAKYIVAIFILPILATVLFLTLRNKKLEALLGTLVFLCLPLILLMAIYALVNFSSLYEFVQGQSLKENAPIGEIVSIFWKFSNYPYFLAIGGVILLFVRKFNFLTSLLIVGSLIPLIVHLTTGESLSVHQHSIYSLMMISPIAGVFFAALIDKFRYLGLLVAALALAFNFFLATPKVADLGNFWPDTREAVKTLSQRVSPDDVILAESGDVVTLAVYDKVGPNNVYGPFVFSYQDLEGLSAYTKAISDGYFKFIELDKSSFDGDSLVVIGEAIASKYRPIFDDGKVTVFEYIK